MVDFSKRMRGSTLLESSHSAALCPPAPTGPTPSTVGMPMSAVMLPSEPPPVATHPKDRPCSLPSFEIRSASFCVFSVQGIGGRLGRYSAVTFAPPGVKLCFSSSRIALLTRSNSACVLKRTSTLASASGATTFEPLPPLMIPTLTEVPTA